VEPLSFAKWVEGSDGEAVPLRFTREDNGWLLIAGTWEEGEDGPCFSMLTTEPSVFVRKVHDRMPAVLADGQIDTFLDGDLQVSIRRRSRFNMPAL
jgi:putative SOS response-associated peptidase YedK